MTSKDNPLNNGNGVPDECEDCFVWQIAEIVDGQDSLDFVDIIADDYVNGYLFQLAKPGVANANIVGLWENSPTQANDLTGVSWTQ